MEALATIRGMMAGNKIVVPSYQRAYSWDTPVENTDRNTQTDVFLADLEEYNRSNANSPYYFGHFLFERNQQDSFFVIDGQQRLTTIVIFLAALFARLKETRDLSEDEQFCYEDMVRRGSIRRFTTVDYDNQFFIDYVIEQTRTDQNGIETESARRIAKAFNFFKRQLSDKSDEYLARMLSNISKSTCTTHLVQNESEAIQMFLFQNDRGKRPSNLEIVKAQFMYNVHLHSNNDKEALIEEIKNRFEDIYRAISSIEYRINEDDILLYTMRVHFNSLGESSALDTINKQLSGENPIDFIKSFTMSLATSFRYLSRFFGNDERAHFEIHSLITLGGIAVALPFIIKAYKYGLDTDKIERLCASLEHLVLRHRLIGTRADITPRIEDAFEAFTERNKDISPIIDRINFLKTTEEWWWAYWNNEELKVSLQGAIHHSVAKFLLWKYENHLRSQGKSGYSRMRFDQIKRPELEHIAPVTEPSSKPHGYDEYDEEFRNQYIHCLGNYLLLSKSHNTSIHNDPFPKKHQDYKNLEQQREIRELVPNPQQGTWSRELIRTRKEKIVSFIMDNF